MVSYWLAIYIIYSNKKGVPFYDNGQPMIGFPSSALP